MPVINKSVDLPATPDVVWQKLTDFGNYGDWNVTHVGFPDGPPADVTEGASYKEQLKIMGMPGEVAWSVTAADAPSHLALDGAGPMGTFMKFDYKLEAADGGTRLSIDSEFGGAALGPMEAMLQTESEKALDQSVEKLKGLLA
jgi:carbon monoxide dehydrogenase subunit G